MIITQAQLNQLHHSVAAHYNMPIEAELLPTLAEFWDGLEPQVDCISGIVAGFFGEEVVDNVPLLLEICDYIESIIEKDFGIEI